MTTPTDRRAEGEAVAHKLLVAIFIDLNRGTQPTYRLTADEHATVCQMLREHTTLSAQLAEARDASEKYQKALHVAAGQLIELGSTKLALAEAQGKIERYEEALEPFVQIAKRMGWDKLSDPEDYPTLIEHVVEAPAEDIAPGAVYCLAVGAFTDLIAALPTRYEV